MGMVYARKTSGNLSLRAHTQSEGLGVTSKDQPWLNVYRFSVNRKCFRYVERVPFLTMPCFNWFFDNWTIIISDHICQEGFYSVIFWPRCWCLYFGYFVWFQHICENYSFCSEETESRAFRFLQLRSGRTGIESHCSCCWTCADEESRYGCGVDRAVRHTSMCAGRPLHRRSCSRCSVLPGDSVPPLWGCCLSVLSVVGVFCVHLSCWKGAY